MNIGFGNSGAMVISPPAAAGAEAGAAGAGVAAGAGIGAGGFDNIFVAENFLGLGLGHAEFKAIKPLANRRGAASTKQGQHKQTASTEEGQHFGFLHGAAIRHEISGVA